ncbi:MAG: hypothetical protein ACOZJZ_00015 [Pseudomonadota bacterium]
MMPLFFGASSPVKSTELIARVIKADGTVIEHGRIAFSHRNPLVRLAWRIGQWRVRLAQRFPRLFRSTPR